MTGVASGEMLLERDGCLRERKRRDRAIERHEERERIDMVV